MELGKRVIDPINIDMKKNVLKILVILICLSSCKNENVTKNQNEERLKEFLVLGKNSKKISEFPSPWISDSYFVDFTYPELKSSYDTIEEPNFCKHYIIVQTSCGTSCQTGFMIDVRNGDHYELPRPSIDGWEGNGNFGIDYNAQYNLLVEHQELLMDGNLVACNASWKWDEQEKKFNLIYPVGTSVFEGIKN
jgi:hypothetical protein